jgi:hypothetical protein
MFYVDVHVVVAVLIKPQRLPHSSRRPTINQRTIGPTVRFQADALGRIDGRYRTKSLGRMTEARTTSTQGELS